MVRFENHFKDTRFQLGEANLASGKKSRNIPRHAGGTPLHATPFKGGHFLMLPFM